jgi:hypothetical protein
VTRELLDRLVRPQHRLAQCPGLREWDWADRKAWHGWAGYAPGSSPR